MLDQEQIMQLAEQYVLPWSIKLLLALVIFVVGQVVASIVSSMLGKLLTHTKLDKILVEFIQSLIRAVLLIIVLIAALDQLGVNTNSVIAILGAAGLAIGLALQGSLQNFAAGFMLLIFRPFKGGDFVEAAGTAGMVERIGIFCTTLHTGDNKEVIIPNGAIYSGNIVNYSKRPTRRIDMVFSIGYDDDIRTARDVIARVISEEPLVLPEPEPLIAVGELGAHSVNFFVRPWVKTEDFWPVKYALTERIKLAFDEQGISIPFPQMDLHWKKPSE